jgi:hypothetical protein
MDGPAEVRRRRPTGVLAYSRVWGGTVCEMCSDARPSEARGADGSLRSPGPRLRGLRRLRWGVREARTSIMTTVVSARGARARSVGTCRRRRALRCVFDTRSNCPRFTHCSRRGLDPHRTDVMSRLYAARRHRGMRSAQHGRNLEGCFATRTYEGRRHDEVQAGRIVDGARWAHPHARSPRTRRQAFLDMAMPVLRRGPALCRPRAHGCRHPVRCMRCQCAGRTIRRTAVGRAVLRAPPVRRGHEGPVAERGKEPSRRGPVSAVSALPRTRRWLEVPMPGPGAVWLVCW